MEAQNGSVQEFNKTFYSANSRSILISLGIPSILLFYWYTSTKAEFILVILIIFLGIIIYKAIQALNQPTRIVLTYSELDIDGDRISWESISKISFGMTYRSYARPGFSEFLSVAVPVQEIEIRTGDNCVYRLYPRIYDRHKEMRMAIESIALKKGIATKVEDRGC